MKIHHAKLKRRIEESGADITQLAAALVEEPTDKRVKLAERKVRNWSAGRDHPAAKPREIGALAQALGCDTKDIASFRSTYRWARSSPRKARLVADMIRGRNVAEAKAVLEFSPKRAAVMVGKALDAAISDAEHADADVDGLVVSEARVDAGVIIKRFRPKDRGRAHPIMKRTSHITIAVEEAG